VEREGLSFSHPARFLLVGTMNPEEGELRPQFLDRFGLCVAAERISDLSERQEIVRRHLEFEADPAGFTTRWEAAELLLTQQIVAARSRLRTTQVPEEMMARAVKLADLLQVHGHRADIAIMKAARAHAALMEKSAVTFEDIGEAAKLALAHRLATSPLDSPEQIRERIFRALKALDDAEDAPGAEPEGADEGTEDDWERMAESMQIPGSCAAGSILFDFLKKKTLKPSTSQTNS
jgi:Mg-chelatase subunit ChlI